MSWLSGWLNRIELTINSSKIDEDLTNFPLLITLTSGTVTDAIFDEVGENSKKIAVVVDSDQCYIEIESWNALTKSAYLWSKIPTVVSGTNTRIYLYYDSSQNDNITYVGSNTKIDTSTGIRLEPDTAPYTGTTLTPDADLVDSDRETAASNWWLADYSYGLDFGEVQTFDEIRIYGIQSGGGALGTTFLGADYDTVEVFVSDDNSSWTSVESFDAPPVTACSSYSYMTLSLSTVQTSRYVKVVCTDSENIADSGSKTWFVTEVEAYMGVTVAQNVWDSDFEAVYHLAQDPSVGGACITDSTANGNDLSTDGSMTSDDLISARIGDGLDMDSDDQLYCTAPDIGTSGVTISMIIKGSARTQWCRPFTIDYDSGVHPGVAFIDADGSGAIGFMWADTDGTHGNSDNIVGTSTWSTDGSTWQHIHGAWDMTGDDGELYVDGVSEDDGTTSSWSSWNVSNGNLAIGEQNSDPLQGVYDEVRVSKTKRSAAWIKADYYSCFNSLVSFGSIESAYYFSGYTKVNGVGTGPRSIYAFRRDTGAFVGSTTSSGSGYFRLSTTYSGSHLIVALDNDAGSDYNDLIFGRVYPAIAF